MITKWFCIPGVVFLLLSAGEATAQTKYGITVKDAVDIAFKNVTDLKDRKSVV